MSLLINLLKEKLLWITGAISALVFFYLLGRKDGKNEEQAKQKEILIDLARNAKHIDDLPDADIDRLQSKYD